MIKKLILNNYDKKAIIYIAVFGCLWGLNEVTFGTFLKSFKIPFSGAVLASIASIIISVSSTIFYKKGSVMLMGIVACIIKLSYLGNFLFGPIIAILLEGIIAELIVKSLKNGLFRCVLLGILLSLYSVIHLIVTNLIVYGIDFYRIYLELVRKSVIAIGFSDFQMWHFILIYISVYFILGLIAGIIAYGVIRNISKLRKEFIDEGN